MRAIIVLISCCLASLLSNAQTASDRTHPTGEYTFTSSIGELFVAQTQSNQTFSISQCVIQSFKIGIQEALITNRTPNKDLEITAYPNPVLDKFQILLKDINPNTEIELIVTDVHGRTVFDRKGNVTSLVGELNFEKFVPGIYILSIDTGNQTGHTTLIKR